MPRRALISLIKLMFVVLVLAFLFVLLRSLSGPSNFSSPKNLFDDVVIGQTTARRVGSDRVWVTRLSAEHRAQANAVAAYVSDPSAGCAPQQDLCVLTAATARQGIGLTFSAEPPLQLRGDFIWHGGFVDPVTGEVFDRLGRAYQQTALQRVELPQIAW